MKTLDILLEEQYEKNNYEIIDRKVDNNLCYIYFSSNALYKKDDKDDFSRRVINGNRYEWSNIRVKRKPKREILIRDIWLSWYVKGINSRINSYEKLVDFLKEKTKGYIVHCVGASSGGYMGNIVAMELEAEISYCFAGQFSMRNHFDHIEKNPYLKEHVQTQGDYWIEYYTRLENSETNILYFCPINSAQDKEQYEIISRMKNAFVIKVDQNSHGVCIFPTALPVALSMTVSEYYHIFENIVYSKKEASIIIGGTRAYLYYRLRKTAIKILKALKFPKK